MTYLGQSGTAQKLWNRSLKVKMSNRTIKGMLKALMIKLSSQKYHGKMTTSPFALQSIIPAKPIPEHPLERLFR